MFFKACVISRTTLEVDVHRQFSKLHVWSYMSISGTKPSREMLSVPDYSYGYLVLIDISFLAVAFIVWQQWGFLWGWFLRFFRNSRSEKSAILTTFRKSNITPRVFNIFEFSFLLVMNKRPLYQNLKEICKYLEPFWHNLVLKLWPNMLGRKTSIHVHIKLSMSLVISKSDQNAASSKNLLVLWWAKWQLIMTSSVITQLTSLADIF